MQEQNKKIGALNHALLWFGAAVSIAEIMVGTSFAGLGFTKGMAAIIIGHLIGGALLFAAGMIGAREEKSAMETVAGSFGVWGSKIFAVLNVLQLVGWTAIMIFDGALAANHILEIGLWVWALMIGALIILWVLLGVTGLGKINVVIITLLFLLSVLLGVIVFGGGVHTDGGHSDGISFGMAIELSATMPISWLPLISDYTKDAKKPFVNTLASVISYTLVSVFMYTIGMGAALFTGEGDIAKIMVKAGLGAAGLLIIVLSTVTTTFLDAYSARMSAKTIWEKNSVKYVAVFVTIIGTALAIFYPMYDIAWFLYLIGSVFAPMIAIQIVDFFILMHSGEDSFLHKKNLAVWLFGFLIYRYFIFLDLPIGSTLISMAATMLCSIAVHKLVRKR